MAGLHGGRGAAQMERRRQGAVLPFGDTYFAVDVKTDGKSFEAGIPKPLFTALTVRSSATGGSPFVVTRDGQRFLVLEQIEKAGSEPIEVVVNWR
jgi:hypothetical protein